MIGRSPELPHLGLQRPPVTETSVNCLPLTVVKGRFRVQFTAFDADYLERLRQGDAATERHFATYFGDLIRLKLRPRLSAADAIDDVSQETFARVLAMVRNKDGVRQPERLGALVNSVCNHVLQEHYRSKRRIHESIDDESESAPVDRGNSVSGIHEIDETERVVRKILADLPERDRRLLQAVLLDERDKDEVCRELGLSREYLRVLVHRAKQSFKSFYVKKLGEVR